jgi:hypothetical protein
MIYAAALRPHDWALADRLTTTAIGDFEFMMAREQPRWSGLETHDRGELLGGLAMGWLQLDDAAKAAPYLERMIAELPNTPYAKAAAERRSDRASKAALTCLGCH